MWGYVEALRPVKHASGSLGGMRLAAQSQMWMGWVTTDKVGMWQLNISTH